MTIIRDDSRRTIELSEPLRGSDAADPWVVKLSTTDNLPYATGNVTAALRRSHAEAMLNELASILGKDVVDHAPSAWEVWESLAIGQEFNISTNSSVTYVKLDANTFRNARSSFGPHWHAYEYESRWLNRERPVTITPGKSPKFRVPDDFKREFNALSVGDIFHTEGASPDIKAIKIDADQYYVYDNQAVVKVAIVNSLARIVKN